MTTSKDYENLDVEKIKKEITEKYEQQLDHLTKDDNVLKELRNNILNIDEDEALAD